MEGSFDYLAELTNQTEFEEWCQMAVTEEWLHMSEWTYHMLMAFGICLTFLGIYDYLFAVGTPGRWFNVHAFANAITVMFSMPAMLLWIRKPISVVNPTEHQVRHPSPASEVTE